MDFVAGMAFNVILQILTEKRVIQKHLPALAKLFVKLEDVVAMVPDLAAAIEKKRKER